MQTSVVEALKAANLYREEGRIMEQMLVTILPNGEKREHKMSEIDYLDLKIFADEMDIALKLQNPLVQELYAKNAVGLASLIRVVNVETASGFKGSVGAGRQLDAIMLRAEQFQDPTVAGGGLANRRASWIRPIVVGDIGVVGGSDFIEQDWNVPVGAGHGRELPMATTEGLAILGFANPAANLCVDTIQTTYIAQAYNIQNLDFELANPFIGDSIVELKQPLFVSPQETAMVKVNYYRSGFNDELRPIGIWVKMSSNLRTILTD